MMRYAILVALLLLLLCLPVRGEAWQVVGGGTWTLASLYSGGVVGAWYDPSDLSTLFQDSEGTVPVTTTGQPVCRINDKSGNGKHITQPSGSACPTLQDDSGKYYLSFDGNDGLNVAIDLSSTSTITVIMGVYAMNTAAQVICEHTVNSNLNAGGLGIILNNSTGSGKLSATIKTDAVDAAITNATNFDDGKSLISVESDIVPAASIDKFSFFRNKTPSSHVSQVDSGGGGAVFANSTFHLGGRGASPTVGFIGRVYGFILIGELLSDDNRNLAEDYINNYTGAY